jgi:hypothetical protein
MALELSTFEGAGGVLGPFNPAASALDYLIDLAAQRPILDVMRERGNGYLEHQALSAIRCDAAT